MTQDAMHYIGCAVLALIVIAVVISYVIPGPRYSIGPSGPLYDGGAYDDWLASRPMPNATEDDFIIEPRRRDETVSEVRPNFSTAWEREEHERKMTEKKLAALKRDVLVAAAAFTDSRDTHGLVLAKAVNSLREKFPHATLACPHTTCMRPHQCDKARKCSSIAQGDPNADPDSGV